VLLTYFLISYLLAFGIPFVIGYVLHQKREEQFSNEGELLQLNELVVIIPFRNEEFRIEQLLKSIKLSSNHPKEYVFVNDHSTDQSVQLIHDQMQKIPHRVLELPENQSGKKRTIRWGIKNSESKWILSLDADVCFEPDYMGLLEQFYVVELNCLPVHMKTYSFTDRVVSADVVLANAFNTAVSGWRRPIMASGANLLYSRSSFVRHDRIETHEYLASGDDVFLLRDYRKAGAKVNLITHPKLSVQTNVPKTFMELLHQRLRWLSKTSGVQDSLSTLIAVYQALLTFVFTALFFYTLLTVSFVLALKLWVVKSILDMLILYPYFKRTCHLKIWYILPMYELILPVYTMLLFLLLKWFRPVWKNRTV
jgi:cellulose synthase/poly-beta-1,6-N-acetylglucosamine synthase-like glycosyltransferase